jgi:hypothetical protein
MSTYEKLAVGVRGTALCGATAAFGYYLVDWLGEQNLHTWSSGSQALAALGILACLVLIAGSIASFFAQDYDDWIDYGILSFALPSAAVYWIAAKWLWASQNNLGYGKISTSVVFLLVFGVVYSAVTLFVTFVALDNTF